MQINGLNNLYPAMFQNQGQANGSQAVASHSEAGESRSAEAMESAKTQIAEGEAVNPAKATSATLPGRLSIYA